MEGRPKQPIRSHIIGAGLLAALAQMAPPATFYSGRAGSRSRRKRNPPGHKLAKRIKMMCGGR